MSDAYHVLQANTKMMHKHAGIFSKPKAGDRIVCFGWLLST